MELLTLIGAIAIFLWVIGLVFKIGGKFIKFLLILGVIAFILEFLLS